jgi:iron-sulfur cluster assembly accessory protein
MTACRSLRWTLFASVAALGFGCDARPVPDTPRVRPETPQAIRRSEPKVGEPPLVTVTPKAAAVITALVASVRQDGVTGPLYLRLRVLPGGCCGFLHKLDLDPVAAPPMDRVCESEAVKVVVWASQVEMLRGATVDHGEKDGRTGFIIVNPNLDGEAVKKWLPKLEASVPEHERPKPAPVAPLGERIAQFRRMAADDPENELGHYRLGQLLMEDGQYAEAVKSFERTLELSPQFSKVYQLLGECLVKLGRKERAVAVLTKGWTVADQKGDEAYRDAMAKLLTDLGAAVPQGKSEVREEPPPTRTPASVPHPSSPATAPR